MAIRFSFKGNTDSFVLTTLAVPKSCYSLGARTTFDRGTSFCSLYPAPQALATSLRMTYRLAIATIVECAASRRLVIAKVRVSGGHLCKAEAPTEPAGEICKRLWQSVFLSRVLRILSRYALRMTSHLVIVSTERCVAIRFSFETPA